MLDTQITLGGFENRQLAIIDLLPILQVENFDHPDILVGTAVRACPTANACLVIDLNDTGRVLASNRAGRATDQAHGISALHAGVGHHMMANNRTMSHEARVSVMGVSAGLHAIVATRAAVHIDQHGLLTVDQSTLYKLLQPLLVFRSSLCLGDGTDGPGFDKGDLGGRGISGR